jgi:hypothetical protein
MPQFVILEDAPEAEQASRLTTSVKPSSRTQCGAMPYCNISQHPIGTASPIAVTGRPTAVRSCEFAGAPFHLAVPASHHVHLSACMRKAQHRYVSFDDHLLRHWQQQEAPAACGAWMLHPSIMFP